MSEATEAMPEFVGTANRTGIEATATGAQIGIAIPGDLKVSPSDDGQYLLLYAGQKLLAIYGAMGADPEVVEFADGSSFAVDALLDLVAAR